MRCIPAKRFERPRLLKNRVDIVEVREIGVYFQHPVWLCKYDGPDIKERHLATQKRLVFHPRDDVVQAPGHVEPDRGGGEVPPIGRFRYEDECAMAQAKDKLVSERCVRSFCIWQLETTSDARDDLLRQESIYAAGPAVAYSRW